MKNMGKIVSTIKRTRTSMTHNDDHEKDKKGNAVPISNQHEEKGVASLLPFVIAQTWLFSSASPRWLQRPGLRESSPEATGGPPR